jgi:hypothetical protein
VKSVRQINRWPLLTATLLAVAGVLSLSFASRRPYLSDSGSAWHISKASKMSKSVFYEPNQSFQAQPVEAERVHELSLRRVSPLAVQEDIAPYIPQIDPRNHHFRSPPTSF